MYDIIITVVTSSGIVGILTKIIIGRLKAIEHKNKALELGVQALLRDRMISMYDEYAPQNSVPLHVKDNFENVWKQYEALGENGVMSRVHETFLAMPTRECKNKSVNMTTTKER